MSYLLLGTEGCHLCEEAELILNAYMQMSGEQFFWQNIDIAIDEHWQEQFSLLIPVLFHEQSHAYINWPFDESAVAKFLRGEQAQ